MIMPLMDKDTFPPLGSLGSVADVTPGPTPGDPVQLVTPLFLTFFLSKNSQQSKLGVLLYKK